jgi:hypothetical protein
MRKLDIRREEHYTFDITLGKGVSLGWVFSDSTLGFSVERGYIL